MNPPAPLRMSALLAGMAAGAALAAGAFEPAKLAAIDREIEAAINRGEIPGAVLRLERRGEAYERAYGRRSLVPESEAMTADTVFDAASLTKVLATSLAVALLAERGALDLDAPVTGLLPEFAPRPELAPLFRDPRFDTRADTVENRARVTARHLLAHVSGLPPAISIRGEPWWGHDNGVRRCLAAPLVAKPGAVFRYSDINYILLGEIARRASGLRLDAFAAREIFAPLGMEDTAFLPGAAARGRIAPTESFGPYGVLRGEVHDPVARRMEGVAGHAGVFTTAADVARFARAFLAPAEGAAVVGPRLAAEMTRPQNGGAGGVKRGLGWDIDSPFSRLRGQVFPVGGFGHTGWTGTSLWVDPDSETIVVLMANRNHPSEEGKIKDLRAIVGTLAAEAAGLRGRKASAGPDRMWPGSEQGLPGRTAAGEETEEGAWNGIDVLAAENFAPLAGLRVGLVTNHTGVDRSRRSGIDLLHEAPEVELRCLFAPEHGIRGELDQAVIDDETDARTGLPVYSLYKSATRRPSASQMEGLDALVFDIQDIGCRFYTYISTMGNAMEAAAQAGLRFVVLDRVNPLGGLAVDGPVRQGESSFTAYHDIPVQHGMTTGELARMFAAEKGLALELSVVPARGWSRAERFDATGLPWVNPSPNMRSLTQAILYPGIGLLEFCDVSVGRGTDSPFEVVGAPWIADDVALAAELNAAGLPGVSFVPVRFTPASSVHAGKECGGVRLLLTDRETCRPLDAGLLLAATLHRLHPGELRLREKFPVLLKHPPTLEAVARDLPLEEIRGLWEPELSRFLERREAFLLYD